MIAYAFGEGLGRLACIGRLLGRFLDQAPQCCGTFLTGGALFSPVVQNRLRRRSGGRVLPIQAMTALLYIVVGRATLLFLNGFFATAFIITMVITQAWRVYSETLRADYRGARKLSAYQFMDVLAIFFALALSYVLPTDQRLAAELSAGIETAWQPLVLLAFQMLWVAVFVQFGKSMVTGAEISFHLHHDRI
jgi:hypothetical protein